jgi:hypothetical protein
MLNIMKKLIEIKLKELDASIAALIESPHASDLDWIDLADKTALLYKEIFANFEDDDQLGII